MTTFGELEIGDEFRVNVPGKGTIRAIKISARKAKFFDVGRGKFFEFNIPVSTPVVKVN